jgi:hypothetical protein
MSLSAAAMVVLRRNATTFILNAFASIAVALQSITPHSTFSAAATIQENWATAEMLCGTTSSACLLHIQLLLILPANVSAAHHTQRCISKDISSFHFKQLRQASHVHTAHHGGSVRTALDDSIAAADASLLNDSLRLSST